MVTDIYEKINEWMGAHIAWAQAHPKYGLLFASGLLALWLTGLLLRWKWACEWQFNRAKTWMFDSCSPETRRRIQIVLVGIALVSCLTMFFVWE